MYSVKLDQGGRVITSDAIRYRIFLIKGYMGKQKENGTCIWGKKEKCGRIKRR
ncbi:hypothetical protein [Cytobacillus praedii]|uniref:hypothetical protein n=1 Tax=Cytobacillus praedii TaxID=1742358 RepID=UPI002E1C6C6D|nr:hypothetical protein [Cytobacillus praedii]